MGWYPGLAAENAPGLGCSLVGFGFEHVDDEAARRLRNLADRVRAVLAAAGISVSASDSPDPDGGAVIESSYSGSSGGDCVEVADAASAVIVRDTTNRDGGTLAFTSDAWQMFITSLK
jgi:hypothetical protein